MRKYLSGNPDRFVESPWGEFNPAWPTEDAESAASWNAASAWSQRQDWDKGPTEPWYEWVGGTIHLFINFSKYFFSELSIHNEGSSKDLKKDSALAVSGTKAEMLT